jgi:glycosyltransferase involved in cell wall biosynthesis
VLLSSDSKNISGIKLSCNKGHQNALLAGLLTVTGDAVVSIDADLQDDENSIKDMIDEYHRGYDVVYGVGKKHVHLIHSSSGYPRKHSTNC